MSESIGAPLVKQAKHETMKTRLALFFFLLWTLALVGGAWAQPFSLQLRPQHSFHRSVPHGNYSGITYLGRDSYAVVDDKSPTDGFYMFTITLDSLTGEIRQVRRNGFRSSSLPNRDGEGIAYHAPTGRILMCGEADNEILVYDTLGHFCGERLPQADVHGRLPANEGLESLSCSPDGHTIFTANECAPCFITTYSADFSLKDVYKFDMDKPLANSRLIGVSEICGLSDSTCLLLQREIVIPHLKIGLSAHCKIYHVTLLKEGERTGTTSKRLLASWTTRLNLTNRSFANYEGMCLGPRLMGNKQTVILVSDSQAGYKGVLKDYFKSIVFEE